MSHQQPGHSAHLFNRFICTGAAVILVFLILGRSAVPSVVSSRDNPTSTFGVLRYATPTSTPDVFSIWALVYKDPCIHVPLRTSIQTAEVPCYEAAVVDQLLENVNGNVNTTLWCGRSGSPCNWLPLHGNFVVLTGVFRPVQQMVMGLPILGEFDPQSAIPITWLPAAAGDEPITLTGHLIKLYDSTLYWLDDGKTYTTLIVDPDLKLPEVPSGEWIVKGVRKSISYPVSVAHPPDGFIIMVQSIQPATSFTQTPTP